MKLSVDHSDRSYACAMWINGKVKQGYIYTHPHRTHWHTDRVPQAISKHFSDQIESWEVLYGKTEDIAIEKEFHPWHAVRNRAEVERYHQAVRFALHDTGREYSGVRWVSRNTSFRDIARLDRKKLGIQSPVLTASIMVGYHAGFQYVPTNAPDPLVTVLDRRIYFSQVMQARRKMSKVPTLDEIAEFILLCIDYIAEIPEDHKFELEKAKVIRTYLGPLIDCRKNNLEEKVDAFERLTKRLEQSYVKKN